MVVSASGKTETAAVKRLSLICVLLAVFAGSLFGQRIPDTDIPLPPASGFADQDGLLGKDSAVERRIIGQIQDLRNRHGYRLYVIIQSSLISTNPSDFAARLQQEWLPDGGGLVIVHESDTGRMGFGRGLDTGEGLDVGPAGVPAYELVGILSKSLEEAEGSGTKEIYLDSVMGGISAGLQGYFERKNAPVDSGRSLKLALVMIGSLSLLALCGMGLGWFMGKADKRQSERRVFPPVEVPERLSAPYGGGGGGYGRFGNGSSREMK